jgi:hypothetical protein
MSGPSLLPVRKKWPMLYFLVVKHPVIRGLIFFFVSLYASSYLIIGSALNGFIVN